MRLSAKCKVNSPKCVFEFYSNPKIRMRGELEGCLLPRKRANELEAKFKERAAIPITNAQWLVWLEDNDADFRETLRTAHVRRRELSKRLLATPEEWPDAPPLGPRLTLAPTRGRIAPLRASGSFHSRAPVMIERSLPRCAWEQDSVKARNRRRANLVAVNVPVRAKFLHHHGG